jgi:hypothetical protein
MDVFVIPVGPGRYELYCEQPVAGEEPVEPETSGLFGRIRRRFGGMVRAAEERHRAGDAPDPEPKSWIGRMQDRGMAWAAERIAEQRLLWNLRGQTSATAAHPADMSFEEVHALIRDSLRRDYDRHRRWMLIDGVLFVVTFVAFFPLVVIPGVANLPAVYFGFRFIGHFLSMRGALNALRNVAWRGRSCPPLDELRELALQDPHAREARVRDVAARVRLEQLPKFFDRVAIARSPA